MKKLKTIQIKSVLNKSIDKATLITYNHGDFQANVNFCITA